MSQNSGWLVAVALFVCVLWPEATTSAQGVSQATPSSNKVIYLTFDDGPSDHTQEILDLLARYDATATFFVIGRAAASQPESIEAIYAAGHGLGNHTYNHPSLPLVSSERMVDEVTRTAAAIGGRDGGCLRPPYGARNAAVVKNAEQLGYQLALWTIDPRDWARPGARAIANHVITHAHPDGVVVMHDGGGNRAQTVAALRIILPALAKQGYRFVAMCRDGIAPPPQKQTPPPMPPSSAPILTISAGATSQGSARDSEGEEMPSAPLGVVRITNPKAGATVRGEILVTAVATHPTFRKWQLDLILNGESDTFLAFGESPASELTELVPWDTTRYPNGEHQLRLRVVYEGMNYDEYLLPITVAN
ncbi:MAG: polysaccharide deacetylase family protein [Caldilinea sp.]